MSKRKEICRECYYYDSTQQKCKRYPPNNNNRHYYLMDYDWCGEFKKKGEKE